MESRLIKIDEQVDWLAPWLNVVSKKGVDIASSPNWRLALDKEALRHQIRTQTNQPLCFIPQEELPQGVSYEAHISETGQVPTRSNLHDFFNALVWLTFPKIKSSLNAIQARQIAQSGITKSRGSARDAVTLFDENAALLALTDNSAGRSIQHALRHHQWLYLFVEGRAQFAAHAEVFLFGHALMEKLVKPYKAITAHTLVCWVSSEFHHKDLQEKCQEIDQKIAEQLAMHAENKELLPSLFSPLPVLGVPNWWQGQTSEFYADPHVFRPQRLPKGPVCIVK